MGSYSSTCLGQILQRILRLDNSILSVLQANWSEIMPEDHMQLAPTKYMESSKILIVSTGRPLIYMQHFKELIRQKCNHFLGYEAIDSVKLVQDKRFR